jgi:hypothetical protein
MATSHRCAAPPAIHKQHNNEHGERRIQQQIHVRNKVKPVKPPAKNTSPDASDAAAKSARACPRPAGYVVQLLLVALYMSTYDDRPLSDAHVQHKASSCN